MVFESATDRITPFKFIFLELNKLNGAIVENPLVSKRRATLLIDPLTTIYPITSSPFFVIPLGCESVCESSVCAISRFPRARIATRYDLRISRVVTRVTIGRALSLSSPPPPCQISLCGLSAVCRNDQAVKALAGFWLSDQALDRTVKGSVN